MGAGVGVGLSLPFFPLGPRGDWGMGDIGVDGVVELLAELGMETDTGTFVDKEETGM